MQRRGFVESSVRNGDATGCSSPHRCAHLIIIRARSS